MPWSEVFRTAIELHETAQPAQRGALPNKMPPNFPYTHVQRVLSYLDGEVPVSAHSLMPQGKWLQSQRQVPLQTES